MVLQQASWDPLNCDLYSLVGLSPDQMAWLWFVHVIFSVVRNLNMKQRINIKFGVRWK
jgi:hypothetical protein